MTINLASYNDCTGCGACKASCSKSAIHFDYDKNGFLRPTIDYDKCVGCGLCTNKCPILNKKKLVYNDPFKYTCYTAWTKDEDLCIKCSSGGVSTQLMIEFLSVDKSIVYGASMSDHNTCAHVKATCKEELDLVKGTKYIQSDISWALNDVVKCLKEGYRVLFSGTPCQIAAVYSMVAEEYRENLYTMELICHGVSSKLCTDYTSKFYDCAYVCSYRNKNAGWCVDGEHVSGSMVLMRKDGRLRIIDYKNCFFKSCYGNFKNPSCYNCHFAKPERLADLTIGDQWGLANQLPERAYLGASSVIVCSPKGLSLLNDRKLFLRKDNMSTIVAPDIFHPNWNKMGAWFARHAYIANSLSLKKAYAFLQLNYKVIPLLVPIKFVMRLVNIQNTRNSRDIINQTREKYNWK